MTNHKVLKFPAIAPKFRGKVPPGFINDVKGWSNTKPEIEEALKNGRMLTMDIDMSGKGACSLRCGHCFRRTKDFWKEKRLGFDELGSNLRQAKALGVRSVKIIGPGEPLEDRSLFRLLSLLRELEIIPLIFTKGHVLGDERLSQLKYGLSCDELAEKLYEIGATILQGATSFDAPTEDSTVGKEGYHSLREKALIRLVRAGFADFTSGEPTRLGLSFSPVTPQNIDEALEAYAFARERHIQPVLGPLIMAGKAKARPDLLVQGEEFISLYVKLNLLAIKQGIFTLDDLETLGVSAYGTTPPCSQLSTGMFLRGDGKVLRCPGNDTAIIGDVKEKTLTRIWEENVGLRRFKNPCNNCCPPKSAGCSYPKGFFDEVLRRVKESLG
ncbi:MAG: SPASM domain-containing protein [Candidatus Micrarchaeota archaeon]